MKPTATLLALIVLAGCSAGDKHAIPSGYGSPEVRVLVSDFGGIPDDGIDDTAALQQAVDSGKTVRIKDGVWLINPAVKVTLPSNAHIIMDPGAVLQATASGTTNAFTFWAVDKSNISITGGTMRGVRGGTGLGIGLFVASCADVTIDGVRFEDFETDGLVVTQSTVGTCQRVKIRNCVMANNGRNGASICHGEDITVTGCTFTGSGPHSPASGLDVEPDSGLTVSRISISMCSAYANSGRGIMVQRGAGGSCSDVSVSNCVSFSNGTIGFEFSGITRGTFTGLNATTNTTHGINYNGSNSDLIFSSCQSHGNGGTGIIGSFALGLSVIGCVSNGNAVHGAALEADRLRVVGSDFSNNGYYGLWISAGSGVSITATTATGNAVDQIVNQGTP